MELQASRLRGRGSGRRASPILLLDQNRARWDQLLIRRGLAVDRARRWAGGATGPYALQAAIAACHGRARTGEHGLEPHRGALAKLSRINPFPVVELNRAVALVMAFGPAAGLVLVDALRAEPALRRIITCPPCAAICSRSWDA